MIDALYSYTFCVQCSKLFINPESQRRAKLNMEFVVTDEMYADVNEQARNGYCGNSLTKLE